MEHRGCDNYSGVNTRSEKLYVKYGSYAHGNNEASITYSKETHFSEWRGYPYAQTITMTVQGELSCNHPTLTLSQQITALETAYRTDFQDLVLYTDAGVATQHKITSSMGGAPHYLGPCIDGPKVISFAYPNGDMGEYASHRSYAIVVQAMYQYGALTDPNPGIVRYQETMKYIGDGGPAIVRVPDQNGNTTQRTRWPATPIMLIQSGVSIGFEGYALPLTAVEASHLISNEIMVQYEAPTVGTRNTPPSMFGGTKFFNMEWMYPMMLPPGIPLIPPLYPPSHR
jgi:hypothetical protein